MFFVALCNLTDHVTFQNQFPRLDKLKLRHRTQPESAGDKTFTDLPLRAHSRKVFVIGMLIILVTDPYQFLQASTQKNYHFAATVL
jgi:hypothetical protein